MSVRDNENNRRKRKAKNKDRKEQRVEACHSESVRAKTKRQITKTERLK